MRSDTVGDLACVEVFLCVNAAMLVYFYSINLCSVERIVSDIPLKIYDCCVKYECLITSVKLQDWILSVKTSGKLS